MVMGKYNSTKTRVVPVFDHLLNLDCTGALWLERLIRLSTRSDAATMPQDIGVLIQDRLPSWGKNEGSLKPPLGLLEWLVRNISKEQVAKSGDKCETLKKRKALADRDPDILREGLDQLRAGKRGRMWFVLEGESHPDAFLETDILILVVEGKRTEGSTTTKTKWMGKRSQLIRHMDAAWEVANGRAVLGLLLVEGEAGGLRSVPKKWSRSIKRDLRPDMLVQTLPHRSDQERLDIAAGVLGVAIWQRICAEFSIDWPPVQDTV